MERSADSQLATVTRRSLQPPSCPPSERRRAGRPTHHSVAFLIIIREININIGEKRNVLIVSVLLLIGCQREQVADGRERGGKGVCERRIGQ